MSLPSLKKKRFAVFETPPSYPFDRFEASLTDFSAITYTVGSKSLIFPCLLSQRVSWVLLAPLSWEQERWRWGGFPRAACRGAGCTHLSHCQDGSSMEHTRHPAHAPHSQSARRCGHSSYPRVQAHRKSTLKPPGTVVITNCF